MTSIGFCSQEMSISFVDLKSDHLGLEATNRKIQIEVQIKCTYCGGTVSKSGISKSLVAGCAWP
jgi:DNA-directed RNA polymerase subunit RPC12/RpoP